MNTITINELKERVNDIQAIDFVNRVSYFTPGGETPEPSKNLFFGFDTIEVIDGNLVLTLSDNESYLNNLRGFFNDTKNPGEIYEGRVDSFSQLDQMIYDDKRYDFRSTKISVILDDQIYRVITGNYKNILEDHIGILHGDDKTNQITFGEYVYHRFNYTSPRRIK